ncbi:MAG TPA: 1-deoxy-D-xylulose-5-phosphate reductoisomerase, partial [Microthrixaceae bacterium]|nr:1-deoxy-D-xylulose-5-phosphate reductoisomerase [Microthrixaceae bacterium]
MTGSLTTVSLLGSTGSIGTQTIDVVAAEPDRFRISVLGAGSDVVTLAEQARSVRPDVVVVADRSRAAELRSLVASDIEVDAGPDAFAAAAGSADVVVNAVVGFAGLPVTMAALSSGRRLALANKESLIAAGP